MGLSVENAKSFGEDVIGEIKEENVTFMAGSIAYQAFVSLIPLLALVFILAAALGDQQLAQTVTAYTESIFPGPLQSLVSDYISGGSSGSASAGVIGLVTLVWGTLKIFRGLDTAFSEIYDTDEENSIVDQVKDGLVVLGAVGVALIAAVVATTVIALFPTIPYIGVLSPLMLIAGLTIAFYPMYYLFPDVELDSYKQVLPGVIVAAVGWTLLQVVFRLYLQFTSSGGTSGQDVVGAIVLLLTWLYFGGLLLLVGAVVNAVLNDNAHLEEDSAEGEDDAESTDPRTGGDATPAASSSSALSFEPDDEDADRGDVAARIEELDERERQLREEEERLRDRRGELEQLRAELEEAELLADEGTVGGATLDAVLAENRDLRRRLRWQQKPAWKRTVWRLLGRRPRGGPE